jgi:SAM-dependent methyltransferase
MSRTAQQWDERYAAAADEPGRTVWSAGPNPALAALLSDELAGTAPGRCVDVAAGEGRHAIWLASLGWQVSAVDFSRVGLGRADRAATAAGVEVTTVCADVTTWEPDAHFDLVLCAYLHLPAATANPLLHRLATWVAPGGRLVLLGHDRDNLESGVGGPQDADVLWTAGQLGAAADAAGLTPTRSGQVRRPVTGADRPAIDVVLAARRGDGPSCGQQDAE